MKMYGFTLTNDLDWTAVTKRISHSSRKFVDIIFWIYDVSFRVLKILLHSYSKWFCGLEIMNHMIEEDK